MHACMFYLLISLTLCESLADVIALVNGCIAAAPASPDPPAADDADSDDADDADADDADNADDREDEEDADDADDDALALAFPPSAAALALAHRRITPSPSLQPSLQSQINALENRMAFQENRMACIDQRLYKVEQQAGAVVGIIKNRVKDRKVLADRLQDKRLQANISLLVDPLEQADAGQGGDWGASAWKLSSIPPHLLIGPPTGSTKEPEPEPADEDADKIGEEDSFSGEEDDEEENDVHVVAGGHGECPSALAISAGQDDDSYDVDFINDEPAYKAEDIERYSRSPRKVRESVEYCILY